MLFVGLENENDSAIKVFDMRQPSGRTEQHRHMTVMSTGMHFARSLRDIARSGNLGNRQRIKFSPQGNSAIAPSFTQDTNDPNALMNFDPQFTQSLCHQSLGLDLFKSKFWDLVKLVAKRHQGLI